jgi:serine protease AprX
MVSNRLLFLAFFIFLKSVSFAQEGYYFVRFKDKNLSISPQNGFSKKALNRRAKQNISFHVSDYPVTDKYIKSISSIKGVEFRYASKWLNGVLVKSNKDFLPAILAKDFVIGIDFAGNVASKHGTRNAMLKHAANQAVQYGASLAQMQSIGADKMHELGWNGKGVYIAVFDGGFQFANNSSALAALFQDKRIKFTYNIVDKIPNVYVKSEHGTNVLSCLAAYKPDKLIGVAYGADYALFVSEDAINEKLVEEYNWLRAAEMADSLGVDIISSSLGYNTFDNPSENHLLSELDGRTTVITKAAQMAARKGMVVVNSAGNNYADASWRKIVFPCDADSILAVGSVDLYGYKADFSAIGPTTDKRIKPDVVVLGVDVMVNHAENYVYSSGTSYSAPLVSGLVATLWQMDSLLTNTQLIRYVKQSSSLYCNPNDELGYGIPNFVVAEQLIKNRKENDCGLNAIKDIMYPNPVVDWIELDIDSQNFMLGLEYQILDAAGQEMLKGKIDNDRRFNPKFDLSGLKVGVYFLKFRQKTYKVIKM